MPEVELSAGTIEYEDTGGGGPTIVLLHGVGMDGSLWRNVVADLCADHRCVVLTTCPPCKDRTSPASTSSSAIGRIGRTTNASPEGASLRLWSRYGQMPVAT